MSRCSAAERDQRECQEPLFGSQAEAGGASLAQAQRCSAGTPASACSTCWPQPRQVVLPQREQGAGLHIGGVIRVQTGVIRTKRRQKAEEQAFKAPIKMVFPLVFFIFPAIMIVIGGPAIIQLKNNL